MKQRLFPVHTRCSKSSLSNEDPVLANINVEYLLAERRQWACRSRATTAPGPLGHAAPLEPLLGGVQGSQLLGKAKASLASRLERCHPSAMFWKG